MSRPHRHGPGNAAPPEVLAGRASEALQQAKFKDAIELFKQALRQKPRLEWKGSLADAYCGRAHDLAAKNMFKEAAMVLENTIVAAGEIRDPKFYVTCLLQDGQQQKAAVYLINHPPLSGTEHQDLAPLAAALLVSVPQLPDLGQQAAPEQLRWRDLAVASRAALAAWCDGASPVEIEQRLDKISLRSAFRPLRLLLKNLISPSGDTDQTRQVLETIPPGSPFYPLRQAVEVHRQSTLDADAWNRLSPRQQTFVAEARGLAAPAAEFLARLAAAERAGPGALFNLLIKQTDLPRADVRSACLNLLPQVPDRIGQFEKSFGALSGMERRRIQALSAEARGDWGAAGPYWQDIVVAMGEAAETGGEGLAQGVILRHLAGLAGKHGQIKDGDSFADPVIHFLERACVVDPGHLPSHLALIGHYRRASLSKEWHRLVDDTVRRFPADALVLQQALDAALARKAFRQAEGFARRLLTINSINPGVRRQMIELQISYARKQMRAKRADLALKGVAAAATWERADAPSAPLRIVQGLVERRTGAVEQAEITLRHGVALAGDGVAGWFRARLEAELMRDGDTAWLHQAFVRARETPPTSDAVMAIVTVAGQPEAVENKKAVASVLLGLRSWLLQAASIDWQPAEFEAIAALFSRLALYDLLWEYARAARERDPENPAGRFHAIVARSEGDPDRMTMREEDEIDGLAEAAAHRQDFHMLSRINRFLDGETNPKRRSRRQGHWGPAVEPDDLADEDFMAAFSAMLTEMPKAASANLRRRVHQLGRDEALTELVCQMRSSSEALGMPDPLLRELCAAMLAQAMQDGAAKIGGGRQRSFF
jgi:tetratricopeptide (TPR) repeat protein